MMQDANRAKSFLQGDVVERFEQYSRSCRMAGPSTALRFAQDDKFVVGVLVGCLETND